MLNPRKFWDPENPKVRGIKTLLDSQRKFLLVGGGIILLCSFFVIVSLGGINRSNQEFEFLFFLPYLVYVTIIVLVKSFRLDTKRYYLPIILVFALLIQFLILTTEVNLSDDIYRFLLEGKMLLEGFNPYITSLSDVPSSFTSNFLPLVNNAHITSPYPPLALFLFASLAWIRVDPLLFRLVFSSAFILSIVFLNKLLITNHKWKLVIFAWNPLFHLETGNGSHFESIIVLFLVIALLNLENDRKELASIMFLVTFLLKYYTIFVIPLFWKHLGKTGQRIIGIGILGYSTAIFFYPSLTSGLMTFADEWYFNASVIWVLFEITSSLTLAKVLAGISFILFLVVLVLKANKEEKIPYYYAGLTIGLFLLLQPTFHPWYLFWLFPFILLDNEIVPWSWILLSGLIILSYNVYIQYDLVKIWYESNLTRIMEYFPFYAIFLYENRRNIVNLYRATLKRR